MGYDPERAGFPRNLDERDVRRIAEEEAEKVIKRETLDAFERMGLLKEGKPDWAALSAPARGWLRRAILRERFVAAAIPIAIGLGVSLIFSDRLWLAIGAIFTFLKGGGPQP